MTRFMDPRTGSVKILDLSAVSMAACTASRTVDKGLWFPRPVRVSFQVIWARGEIMLLPVEMG